MVTQKIIWSTHSKENLIDIYDYFNFRNKSKLYSQKLHRIFQSEVKRLIQNNEIGIQTNNELIRGLIVGDYTLFYEIKPEFIEILTVWDNRQNPNKIDYF